MHLTRHLRNVDGLAGIAHFPDCGCEPNGGFKVGWVKLSFA